MKIVFIEESQIPSLWTIKRLYASVYSLFWLKNFLFFTRFDLGCFWDAVPRFLLLIMPSAILVEASIMIGLLLVYVTGRADVDIIVNIKQE